MEILPEMRLKNIMKFFSRKFVFFEFFLWISQFLLRINLFVDIGYFNQFRVEIEKVFFESDY